MFRDVTSLSASPELWPTIERALEGSRYFILLASPDAARSPWVEQEVRWWRAHRTSDTLLIVLTDGELDWDDHAGDFSPASAVPASARGWLGSEPLWVDLRWAREQEHVSIRNPRFLDDVASLAAPLRGLEKDDLVGEDVRQHRRTIRLARGAVAMLTALTVVAIAGSILAEVRRREAKRQERQATSIALAASSAEPLATRPDVSLALAFEAYRTLPRAEARSAAVRALEEARRSRLRGVLPIGDDLRTLAFSPNGKILVTASFDKRVRLWDLTARTQLGRLTHSDAVNAVAFSHDGAMLAIAGSGGTVSLWDPVRRKQLGRVEGHPGSVYALAFSPGDETLVSAGSGGTIRQWDLATHRSLGGLVGHRRAVYSVQFSPDGTRLVTASEDSTVRVWDLPRRIELARLDGDAGAVYALALSPDGETLASAHQHNTVRLWDIATRSQLGRLAHPDAVASVAFSPDGKTLATAGQYTDVRLWDVTLRKQLAHLRGHAGGAEFVEFSLDGKTLACRQ